MEKSYILQLDGFKELLKQFLVEELDARINYFIERTTKSLVK